jgi:RNAse (barnase) inhibitor barstar
MGFPEFYGGTWDAFWDAITSLVELPDIIIFKDWARFETKLPNEARILKECFARASKEFPERSFKIRCL